METSQVLTLINKQTNEIYDPQPWTPIHEPDYKHVSDKDLNIEVTKICQQLADTQAVDWQVRVKVMKRI